ncbi:MAG: RNA polymerase sigma factor [Minisyncoccota bacterium]
MSTGVAQKRVDLFVLKSPQPTKRYLKLLKDLREVDDETLILAYIAGNDKAFTEIYNRYQPKIISFINKSLWDRERSEDISQEVFLRVHKNVEKFDASRKFSTWIFTIASNLTKNELRNRSKNPVIFHNNAPFEEDLDTRIFSLEDPKSTPDRLFDKRTIRNATDRAVSKMPQHQRKIFTLREIYGLTYEEIQAIVDINLGTIKSRLHRARQIFKKEMVLHWS